MKISDETEAELRRLHAEEAAAARALDDCDLPVIDLTYCDLIDKHEDALIAFTRAIKPWLIPLLDDITAAEAERDRLRAGLEKLLDGICYKPGFVGHLAVEQARAALGGAP